MSDETWNRYCEKLEELRRLEDERRKRRKGSTGVEISDKGASVNSGVPGAAEVAPGTGEDDGVITSTPPPRP